MAGTVALDVLQVGADAIATRNCAFRTNGDGSFVLARGNAGATTQDLIKIDSAGLLAFSVPSFSAKPNAASVQTVPASSDAIVVFGVEQWDTANLFDTSNNRFVPNADGTWRVNVHLQFSQRQEFWLSLRKNGTEVFFDAGNFSSVNCDVMLLLTTADYVDVQCRNAWAGGSNFIDAGSYFQAIRVA